MNNRSKMNGVSLTMKPRDTSARGFDNRHFLVEELVVGLVGAVENASVDPRTGDYVIKVNNETQANRLCKAKKLKDGFGVKIERCDRLNKSKVVIRSELIAGTTDRDLLKQLGKQGATEVRAISPDMKTRVITFKLASPPAWVNIGLVPVRTETYYPPPITCWTCMRLGHPKANCGGKLRCARCSGEHAANGCTEPLWCVNCTGPHKPLDKTCPAYLQEKRIIKIQTDTGCSAKAARRRYRKDNRSDYYPIEGDRKLEKSDVPGKPVVTEDKAEVAKPPATPEREAESEDEVQMILPEDASGKGPIVPRPIGSVERQPKPSGSKPVKKASTLQKPKPPKMDRTAGKYCLRLTKPPDDFKIICKQLDAAVSKAEAEGGLETSHQSPPPKRTTTYSDVSSDDDH